MHIKGLDFELTCSACPEQYSVFLDDQQVGYVRLRWGTVSASLGNAHGEEIYRHDFNDEWLGIFPDEVSREFHLEKIADCIIDRYGITYLLKTSGFEDEEPDSI